MFWRKKPDGFEWHEYIRTTVLVRRKARKQRVQDARQAAGQQMQAAGVALVEGSRAAGGALWQGTRAGAGALGLGTQAGWELLGYLVQAVVRPVVSLVSRPNIGGPLAFLGAIALGAGIGRLRGVGLDREAFVTLALGAVPMLCLLARWTTWRPPQRWMQIAGPAAGLLALIAVAAWLASASGFMSGFTGLRRIAAVESLSLAGADRTLQGYAYAAGGDSLRLADTVVRLSGIEAPEGEQRCDRAGRSWRCGAAAETGLARLVNGRKVSCAISGSDAAGHGLARCTVGQKDVAAELVRQGHVFAEGGILPRYGSEEREARAAKAGLWSGDAERPAAYRAKVWEDAKRRAPDGCPIKGQVSGSARFYVLPWSADYERIRVQKGRGERWFCSEQEAVAAGFRAAQGG